MGTMPGVATARSTTASKARATVATRAQRGSRMSWRPSQTAPGPAGNLPEYTVYHQISTIGSYVLAVGLVMVLANWLHSLFAGKRAPANPWGEGATTLEWQLSSPPPFHQWEQLPRIK